MTNPISPSLILGSPFAWVGRQLLNAITYLGRMGVLLASAGRSLVHRDAADPPLRQSVVDELSWMLGMGLPLVALVHVGLGSFLAMQSYFGGTFVEGTGAVVGVGLFRNVAALMSGLTLAGFLAARVTADLRSHTRSRSREPHEPPRERGGFLERTASGLRPPAVPVPAAATPAHRVAAFLIAGTTAGPILGLWGASIGTVVGWQVAETLMGVSAHSFFFMFWEMLWALDIVSLLAKGMAFGFVSALLACHEGLGTPSGSWDGVGLAEVSTAACRAACLSAVAILVINSGWFIVVYHAGPAYGPTLLAPPSS